MASLDLLSNLESALSLHDLCGLEKIIQPLHVRFCQPLQYLAKNPLMNDPANPVYQPIEVFHNIFF
jgi:hypothetical protein